MSLKDAVAAATAPYRGFTYFATGNRYYDSTATAAIVDKYNDIFKLNLTPDELTEGVKKFGDWHRQQFGFAVGSRGAWDNYQSWVNENGAGNFTTISDPTAIARESIANALRARGLSEETLQSKFYFPLQSESSAGTKWAEDAAAGLREAQRIEHRKLNPEIDTSWGSLFEDMASDPVAIAIIGTALFASGAISFGLDAASGAFGAEALTGEVIAAEATAEAFAVEAWSANAAAEVAAAEATAGTFSTEAWSANAAAETATSTATTGATNVDSISDWLSNYSSDPGPDPFATTADVNTGWSYNGGYEGVDWYNNAGIGEASSATSLNDIFSNVSKALKSAGSILSGVQQIAGGQNRVQPNMTRTHAAGQMNLALPLLLGAAFFAFRG